MKINEIAKLIDAALLTSPEAAEREVTTAYAGDMLSDVLALGTQPEILITGLMNPQVIRTAQMLDTPCVIFVRGKEPTEAMLELARDGGISVLCTPLEMYPVCAALARAEISTAQ